MNALEPRLPALPDPTDAARDRAVAAPRPTKHLHREREFGIGYGNNSGYASDRRYTADRGLPCFRCA